MERPWDDKSKRYKTELAVDEIRRTVGFFGSTSGEGGWRIAIVDPADDMNPSAANALLKMLEEPPSRSLFLIVSHAPGRLLPTIRSRCRRLDLAPLPAETIADGDPRQWQHRCRRGRHPPRGRAGAREACGARSCSSRRTASPPIAPSPASPRTVGDPDIAAMHALADSVSGRGADDAYEGFLDTVRAWLGRRVRGEPEPVAEATPGAGGPGRSACQMGGGVGKGRAIVDRSR